MTTESTLPQGGSEALPELASMLGDSDPQVQRESIRAIVQIATREAHAILERVLVTGGRGGQTALEELIALRDDKAIPLLCFVLTHTRPRGARTRALLDAIDALGSANTDSASTRALSDVLHRGEWWAPFRTATLRHAAAAALQRIGSADAQAALEQAATNGARGVRRIARIYATAAPGREAS